MAFDIEGYRKAGHSDDSIADYLATEKGIDAAAARQSGWTTKDMLTELSDMFAGRALPSGVKPSSEGAGRGSVNPPAAMAGGAGLSSVSQGSIARRGGTRGEARPYVAANEPANPSVLDSQAAAANTMDRRGAPVTKEVFDATVSALSLMTPQQRAAQANRSDLPAWQRNVAAKAAGQIAAADAIAGVSGTGGASVDSRAARNMRDGADEETAKSAAVGSILAGRTTDGLQRATATQGLLNSEETTAAQDEGRQLAGAGFGARGMYAAGQGFKQGSAGIIAAGLRAIGDDETAKLYEKRGQMAAVRAEAVGELERMQAAAREAGILPQGPLSGAADYMGRMSEGAANSIGQMMPGIIAGLATGSAGVGLGLMALPVFGNSYIDKRDAGGTPAAAAGYAGAMAGFEIIGERFGLLPAAMNAFRREASKKALEEVPGFVERAIVAAEKRGLFSKPMSAIARGQAGEQIGEQITAAGQYMLDGTALGLDRPVSVLGFLENARDTAIQTLLATGAVQAAGGAAKRIHTKTNGVREQSAEAQPADAAAETSSSAVPAAPEVPNVAAAGSSGNAAQSSASAQAVSNIERTLAKAGALPEPSAQQDAAQDFTGLDEAQKQQGDQPAAVAEPGQPLPESVTTPAVVGLRDDGTHVIDDGAGRLRTTDGRFSEAPAIPVERLAQDDNIPVMAVPPGEVATAGDGWGTVDTRSGGTDRPVEPVTPGGVVGPTESPEGRGDPAATVASANVPNEALTPAAPTVGQSFDIDGKRWNIASVGKASVTIVDAAGTKRVVSSSGKTYGRVLEAISNGGADETVKQTDVDIRASAGGTTAPAKDSTATAPRKTLRDAQAKRRAAKAPDAPQVVTVTSQTQDASTFAKKLNTSAQPVQEPAQVEQVKTGKPKVYKTRMAANKAKKAAGNTQRMKAVKGGFILREATEKELAAAASASRRQAQRTRSGGGPGLLAEVARMGGLDRKSASKDLGVHADSFGHKSGIFGAPTFRATGGKSAEHVLEALKEANYLTQDAGLRELEDAIGRELGGDTVLPLDHDYTDDMQAALDAQRDVDDDTFADLDVEDLQAEGYTSATPEVQALTEQLLSEANALGIDSESLRERVAIETEGETDDQFHAAVQEAVGRAIAEAQADAARRDTGSARPGSEDSGRPAEAQGGSEQGLTGDTKFSRTSTASGMSVEAVQQVADTVAATWANAPPITVVSDMADSRVPQSVRDEFKRQNDAGAIGSVGGFLADGRVYLVASGLNGPQHAVTTMLHEAVGHYGLRGVFGSDMARLLSRFASARPADIYAKARQYGLNMADQSDRLTAAEEVLAELAQTSPTNTWVQRVAAAVRTWLRTNIPMLSNLRVTDAEIVRDFIAPARSWVERGRSVDQQDMAPAFSRNAGPWFSALKNQVSGASMNSGPAGAWQALLKNWISTGKVKADEVEWSGLSDWLGMQPGKVARDAVAEYLAGHGVQVSETVLGNGTGVFTFVDAGGQTRTFDTHSAATDAFDEELEFISGGVRIVSNDSSITVITDSDGVVQSYVQQDDGTWHDEQGREFDDQIDAAEAAEREADVQRDGWRQNMSSGVDEESAKDGTKYANYTLPGGANYREVLLTLPTNGASIKARMAELSRKLMLPDATPAERKAIMAEIAGLKARDDGGKSYTSGHWDQPNVLAHIRVNDRIDADGALVLFVEEIQSDFAQDKRRGKTKANAPFIDSTDKWVALAMKRVIKMAVDGGYDKVAFVTGKQSADRYDLSKQISRVEYTDNGVLVAVDINGREALREQVPEDKIEDYIGKEASRKLLDSKPVRNPGSGDISATMRRIDGDGLKVGGEGMKAFYDKIVPSVANDVLRKLGGGPLEAVTLDAPSGGNPGDTDRNTGAVLGPTSVAGREFLAQPGFRITDDMREKTAVGMPMFSRTQQQAATAPAASSPGPGWSDASGRWRFAPGQAMYDMLGRAASPLLAKIGMKAASPELRHMMRQMRLDVQRAQDVAVAVANDGTRLSDAERALVSDIIEREMAAGTVPPEHAVRLASAMTAALSRQSSELVELGMLSDAASARWEGQYLPRYYESKLRKQVGDAWADAVRAIIRRPSSLNGIRGKHLKGRGLFETIPAESLPEYQSLGWEMRDDGYMAGQSAEVQVWRDFTREERDSMGEVRDSVFRFVMGYMQTQKDIALGRMFKAMASDESFSSRLPRNGWVRVPTTEVEGTDGVRRYGMLAGRFVPMETLSHLSQIEETSSAAWQLYRKALGVWKMGKTMLNPVAHANNIVSNLTMAHFGGVSYHRADKYFGAVNDLAKSAPMVAEAHDAGLFLSTMSSAELLNTLPPELQDLAARAESKSMRGAKIVFDLMTFFLRKPLGKAYEAEDMFFRYLLYRDARQSGMAPTEAVDHAQKYIFTYDDIPRGARIVRDFAMPFFSYTYKAIPALLHTALVYPHRFALPAAGLWAANAIGYAIAAGGDDDWWESVQNYLTDDAFRAKAQQQEALERKHLPPWQRGMSAMATPKAIRLGMDELTGLPLFMDVSRFIPGGDLFDVAPNAGGIPVPQPLTPSHPLLSVAIGMLANKDLFSGKELVDVNDDGAEAAAKRGAWLWKQAAPAITVGNYHWSRLMQATTHANGGQITWLPEFIAEDYTGIGSDGLAVQPKYAIAQTFGVKVRPFDVQRSMDIEAGKQKQMIRSIDAELRQMQRQASRGAVSASALEKAAKAANEKKVRLNEKQAEE